MKQAIFAGFVCLLCGVQASADEPALLIIRLPIPGAEVEINGFRPGDAGVERAFLTPKLPVGKDYVYTVVATWRELGETRKDTREAVVRAGTRTVIDFTRTPPAPTPKVEPEVKKEEPKATPPEPPIDPKKSEPELIPPPPTVDSRLDPRKVEPPAQPADPTLDPRKVEPEPKKVDPPVKAVEPEKTPPKKIDPKDEDSPFLQAPPQRSMLFATLISSAADTRTCHLYFVATRQFRSVVPE